MIKSTTATVERDSVATERSLITVDLEDRNTEELVFAMVGPIGSGCTFAAEIIRKLSSAQFAYDVETIKISKYINESVNLVDESEVLDEDPERAKKLQDIGNKLRKKFGNPYLVMRAIEEINRSRTSCSPLTERRRKITILDSIKNIEEYFLLKKVYIESFWMFGVFAPELVRKKRLDKAKFAPGYLESIFGRDQEQNTDEGQQVQKLMQHADFFIRNSKDTDGYISKSIERYLSILFTDKVNTPKVDEEAMSAAVATASLSACLSRPVGAVIVNADGQIIGRGRNDVPKFSGGLYSEGDAEDKRCYAWRGKECHNDKEKEDLTKEIIEDLFKNKLISKENKGKVGNILTSSRLKGLIEFSRAVHAEMDAIISVARHNSGNVAGATMYTTTFPCHSCARHIVAAGIKKVVYLQPYAKSLALKLHSDSITTDEEAGKCVFEQFEGVAPKNVIRLFLTGQERKRDGKLLVRNSKEARPVTIAPLDSFGSREDMVVGKLVELEGTTGNVGAQAKGG